MIDHSGAHPVALLFGEGLSEQVRSRLDYAFRVFCGVYGLRLADDEGDPEALRFCYGRPADGPRDVSLTGGYRSRPLHQPAPAPSTDPASGLPRFHPGVDGSSDWLGEIFEWISAAHEYSVEESDDVGRVPFAAGLHGRFGLDPTLPYAALAMERLNDVARTVAGNGWPCGPAPPWSGGSLCAIAATHDIDFLPISPGETLGRLLRNAAIGLLRRRAPGLAASILAAGLRGVLRGRSALDGLPSLIRRERQRGMSSTCSVICRRAHRRDANYELGDPRTLQRLAELARQGVELGVHGSYTSLDGPGRLAAEYELLAGAGFPAVGGRQHWLRFRGPELFRDLAAARAWYDCSVGFADRPGFRTGASFPYPPYDFEHEAPFPVLELPLVLMDVTLYGQSRDPARWRAVCSDVLAAVRARGWGGVSVLWHDTVLQGGQLPRGIGDLYWELPAEGEDWISGREMVERVRPRYAALGLLPGARPQGTADGCSS